MLHYAIARNKGAAYLAGEIGLGKTTISRKLLELLDPVQTKVVLIVNPLLTPVQMLQEILSQLDQPLTSRNRQVLVSQLHDTLLSFYDKGKRVVVLVDEAHLIRNTNTFEELRLLLNCQMNDQFLISLLLLGQPELRGKIAKVPALEQRMAVRHTLRPLGAQDLGELIEHRLRIAGYAGDKQLFSPEAVAQLHQASGGTPRVATQLADNALIVGMVQRAAFIDGILMQSVCEEFFGVRGAA